MSKTLNLILIGPLTLVLLVSYAAVVGLLFLLIGACEAADLLSNADVEQERAWDPWPD